MLTMRRIIDAYQYNYLRESNDGIACIRLLW